MKRFIGLGYLSALFFAGIFLWRMPVRAEGEATVKRGIFAGEIELSGMTAAQAEAAVREYVKELEETELTFLASADEPVAVTAGELGISWENSELVAEALEIGCTGNVIERYKIMKDLEHENKVFPIEISFDEKAIREFIESECTQFDTTAKNYSLERVNGEFRISEGQTGYTLDVDASVQKAAAYLEEEWDRGPCSIPLEVLVEEPQGSLEELSQVKDVLGTFTTSYSTSNPSRCANVENGCNLINGSVVYPGEEFSTHDKVTPFSRENGYYMAGSYMNGRVVDSLGGGICQVSTTLYNVVLQAELEVTERHNHSMIVTYVDPSADAAISESAGKDFRFVNNLDYPIYIEGYTQNKEITFTIYGKETRAEDREVRYVSQVLEVSRPPADLIYADGGKPLGYITVEGAHIGYKARLWKVVTEGGKEVSRTEVNYSSYKMVPRSATVGTATDDPAAYEQIMAAIGSGDVNHVRNVIAMLTAPPAAPETPPEGTQ